MTAIAFTSLMIKFGQDGEFHRGNDLAQHRFRGEGGVFLDGSAGLQSPVNQSPVDMAQKGHAGFYA